MFPNSIGSSEVIDNSLTSSDLAANSVEASEIASNAVGSFEILNNSILDLDIVDEPGIDWNNTNGVGNSHDLSSSWKTINRISISHPRSGYVVVIATAHVDYDVSTYHGNIEMGWTTVPTGTPHGYNKVSLDGVIGGTTYVPITTLRIYGVNGTSTTIYYLRARASTATTGGEVDLFEGSQVAMYFPTLY
ncbi:MAG: hypothetical protein IIB00_09370 [candidate division Zixibacteria bacterium]|nr:hypothetical protein [candidate division Zixibacteria bacterium]